MGMPPTQRKSPAPSPPVVTADSPAPQPVASAGAAAAPGTAARPRESGGPAGPEPTRFGDWEKNGRCIDF
jgi:hypothetical protein